MRRLNKDEQEEAARAEMEKLLSGARLGGEVIILPDDGKDIIETIKNYSSDSSLILIGMPGKRAGGIARVFSLDKLFFTKELDKFKDFPPVLFVKAAGVMNLLE
jgi:hypothetical protein